MSNMDLGMKRPNVGIGIIVLQEGQILLGKRNLAHGSGTWCPPGGHLEYGESPAACAARELEEETSLVATNIVPGPWTNDFFESEGTHYVSLYMIVRDFVGVPKVTEPEKCLRWNWFDFDQLPQPLFLSLHNLLENHTLEALQIPS